MTTLDTWDRTLFLKISAGPGAPEALLNTAIFIATDAIYVIPLMLVAMWVWGDEKKRGLALFAATGPERCDAGLSCSPISFASR